MRKSSKSALTRSLLEVAFLIGCACFFVGFLSLHKIQFGYERQTDPVLTGFWILGGGAFLLIFRLIKSKPSLMGSLIAQPIVWTHGLLALCSAVLSIFHVSLGQSWTGSPQIGEGVLSYLSLMALTILFSLMSRIPSLRKGLVSFAFLSGSIMAVSTFVGSGISPWPEWRFWIWAPYHFLSYLAFVGLAFLVFYRITRPAAGIKIVWQDYTLMPLAIGVLYISANKTALSGVLIIGLILGILYTVNPLRSFQKYAVPLLLRNLLPWMCVGIIVGFVIAVLIYKILVSSWPEVIPNKSSLFSRGLLIELFLSHLGTEFKTEDILYLLFGKGWGTCSHFIAENMFTLDVALFKEDQWAPSWESVNRDHFHSHNAFMEHFSAIGIVGALVFLVTKCFIMRSIRLTYIGMGTLYFLTMAILMSSWFELTATWSFGILATALLCRRPTKRFPVSVRVLKNMSLFAGFLLLGWGVIHGVATTRIHQHVRIGINDRYTVKVEGFLKEPANFYDLFIGGQRVNSAGRFLTFHAMEVLKATNDYDPAMVFNTNRAIARYLLEHYPQSSNIYMRLVPLNIFSELISSNKTRKIAEETPGYTEEWENALVAFLTIAPRRSDMAISLLSYYLSKNNISRVHYLTTKLLVIDPHTPIGLWFKGLADLENSQTKAQGIRQLKESLDKGIQRFMPISEKEVKAIQNLNSSF